ncbi:MAG: division/cell wall cluster transcriptional repressor MraZ [Patescibacteria group bacterium]|nr:division/cell wall cluster transcriptional repressor MraZ [Patescibacteria group bacterium]
MFIGEYKHTLDEKKRLSLPARFRKEAGRRVIVTRGLDACLFVFPIQSWNKIARKISELPVGASDTRGIARFILSGATESDVDTAGRILIPDFLKDFASLGTRVVVAGTGERIEIWSERSWGEYTKRIERGADKMAQALGDLGIL